MCEVHRGLHDRGVLGQQLRQPAHVLLRVAGIAQEHAVFWGAAGCAVVAAVLALVLFRQVRPTRLTATDVFTGGA